MSPAPALPRCGDTVRHRPTGETWLVAFAHRNEIAWCGWPDGRAHLSDCEVIERCSDEGHAKAVAMWLDDRHVDDRGQIDTRVAMVRHLYRPEEERRLKLEALRQAVSGLVSRVRALDAGLADAMERFAAGTPEATPAPTPRYDDCVCSDPAPHFCPPCLGEPGFYACDPVRFPPAKGGAS